MNEVTPPLNVTQLNARLADLASDFAIPLSRARVMMCTLVVSQMLPDSVAIKGGMGVKLRLGERGTRATADLDVSTRVRGVRFEQAFRARLAKGWGCVPASHGQRLRNPLAPDRVAFTASVRARKTHNPGLARPENVMHPYRVSIAFLGRAWSGLDVEVSDPEIDVHAFAPVEVASELTRFANYFGFGSLESVNFVDVEFQFAQKLHAVTDPNYERAHDLVDLQLIWNSSPDVPTLRRLCLLIFSKRDTQPWPPLPLRPMTGWELAYSDAWAETQVAGAAPVLSELEMARVWLAETIELIEGNDKKI